MAATRASQRGRVSCELSLQHDGVIGEDGESFEGRAGFLVEIEYVLMSGDLELPQQESCEGINQLDGTRLTMSQAATDTEPDKRN